MNTNARRSAVFIVIFSLLGAGAVLLTRAAGPFSSLEAEDGTLTGRAVRYSSASASGDSFVRFDGSLTTAASIAKIIGKSEDGKSKIFFNPHDTPAAVQSYKLLRNNVEVASLTGSQISAARLGNYTGVSAHLEVISPDPIKIASSTRSLDEIAADGYGYTRIDFYWSGATEPSDQNFNWTTIDSAVDRAHARGLKVIAMPTYSPHWTRPAGTTDKTPPTDLNQYAEFVEAAVARYGANSTVSKYRTNPVKVWELWNEPNLRCFWQDPSNYNPAWVNTSGGCYNPLGYGPSPARYTRMIRLAYDRAKAKDPTAFIMVGGLAVPIDMSSRDFLAGVYYTHFAENGSQPVPFDGVAVHPYSSKSHPLTYQSWNSYVLIDDVRRLMESISANEATKPIWGTEASYSTICNASYLVCDILSNTTDGKVSQAYLLSEAIYNWHLYKYVGPYNIYLYKDLAGQGGGIEDYYGLVKNDFTPKLSKEIIKAMNKQIIITDPAPQAGQQYNYQVCVTLNDGRQVTTPSYAYTASDFRQ